MFCILSLWVIQGHNFDVVNFSNRRQDSACPPCEVKLDTAVIPPCNEVLEAMVMTKSHKPLRGFSWSYNIVCQNIFHIIRAQFGCEGFPEVSNSKTPGEANAADIKCMVCTRLLLFVESLCKVCYFWVEHAWLLAAVTLYVATVSITKVLVEEFRQPLTSRSTFTADSCCFIYCCLSFIDSSSVFIAFRKNGILLRSGVTKTCGSSVEWLARTFQYILSFQIIHSSSRLVRQLTVQQVSRLRDIIQLVQRF